MPRQSSAAVLLVAMLASVDVALGQTADRTIIGEVVELSCELAAADQARGDAHAVCAMSCARKGHRMAVLTTDGVYTIEGDYAANGNARLLDFVARRVYAKGKVTEADGGFSITVASMALAKD